MKKSLVIISSVIFLVGCVYLLIPSPTTPDLDNAVRSDEEGDTWQHPDQKGFYSNQLRSIVIPEMQSKFSISLFGVTIPSLKLNYRPEDTKEFVREQTPSYYLEEIVYPFRESLFVNGWEPTNSPIYSHLPDESVPNIIFKQTVYLSKVTLRPVFSPVWARILVWALVFPATYLTYLSLHRSLRNGKS